MILIRIPAPVSNGTIMMFFSMLNELEPKSLLFLTLEFWSGWSDSAVHNWNFYEPLGKSDWPRLAKVVLSDLKENREITNQEILSQFSVYPKSKSSWLSKLLGVFNGKAI